MTKKILCISALGIFLGAFCCQATSSTMNQDQLAVGANDNSNLTNSTEKATNQSDSIADLLAEILGVRLVMIPNIERDLNSSKRVINAEPTKAPNMIETSTKPMEVPIEVNLKPRMVWSNICDNSIRAVILGYSNLCRQVDVGNKTTFIQINLIQDEPILELAPARSRTTSAPIVVKETISPTASVISKPRQEKRNKHLDMLF